MCLRDVPLCAFLPGSLKRFKSKHQLQEITHEIQAPVKDRVSERKRRPATRAESLCATFLPHTPAVFHFQLQRHLRRLGGWDASDRAIIKKGNEVSWNIKCFANSTIGVWWQLLWICWTIVSRPMRPVTLLHTQRCSYAYKYYEFSFILLTVTIKVSTRDSAQISGRSTCSGNDRDPR